MAMVYVVTAGSGDTYRIERIYLDGDEAYGFAQAYNGIAPVEPVQVEEWQIGVPPAAYDGPYWRAEWWARIPDSKRRGALRNTDEGERFDDFAIRQEWWTGEELPEASWCAGNWPACPGWKSSACPRTRWKSFSGTPSPRSAPTWRAFSGNSLRSVCGGRKEMGMAARL